jgi:predicted HicB family RNase H-like nuclease
MINLEDEWKEATLAQTKKSMTREVFSTRVDPDLIRQLKHLAVDEGKALNELLEEAIGLLLISRRKDKAGEGTDEGKSG